MRKFLVILCAAFSLLSCNENSREKKVLDEIKEVGNHDPLAALVSYDSIRREMEGASDYIYNRYELLGVRLHDKADILPTSDSCIRRLVAYFEQKGNNAISRRHITMQEVSIGICRTVHGLWSISSGRQIVLRMVRWIRCCSGIATPN